MRFPRSSGVLLHITSLPGDGGVGDLGPGAYRFVDFLENAGQQLWQLLPLGPPAYGNSPYSCYSAFAGNPLLISPSQLVDDGFLPAEALDEFLPSQTSHPSSESCADFGAVEQSKQRMLAASYDYFQSTANTTREKSQVALTQFCESQKEWLDDFTLFVALAEKHDALDWTTWPQELARRDAAAMNAARNELKQRINFAQYVQFLFFQQWGALKAYANERNIRMFGDMPIFVAHSSADVWANQELFWLDPSGQATVVAGVPPDYFSETGQRWGNPLYDWNALAKTNYVWWTERFRGAFEAFDLIRIDHFRGFESYWEIPADAPTAVTGQWVKGPGTAVFRAAEQALGELPIVAEDLGLITDEVHELRDALKFPGMRVLQFGYDNVEEDYHRAEVYPEHSAAYTGTHDNDTVMSWYAGRDQLNPTKEAKGTDASATGAPVPAEIPVPEIPEGMNWVLIGMVFDSASDTAVVPMQDILGLGNEARMNKPGEADGNWTWRCTIDAFNSETAGRLRQITESSNRLSLASVAVR